MAKVNKTNAMRILDKNKIEYKVHLYDISDGLIDGISVANKCNEDINKVFKTLVTISNNNEYYVFVIPVNNTLDLRNIAKELHLKSINMVAQKDLLPLTGYIHGGCSPIGMKKLFPTYIDDACLNYETIYVSAGKVGMQIELNPQDLLKVIEGKTLSFN